jgi:hypothetical protein
MSQFQSLALYLRTDGSLMVANGEGQALEMALTPAQLVQLGVRALRIATSLDPACMPAVLAAFETTHVLPASDTPQCPLPN